MTSNPAAMTGLGVGLVAVGERADLVAEDGQGGQVASIVGGTAGWGVKDAG